MESNVSPKFIEITRLEHPNGKTISQKPQRDLSQFSKVSWSSPQFRLASTMDTAGNRDVPARDDCDTALDLSADPRKHLRRREVEDEHSGELGHARCFRNSSLPHEKRNLKGERPHVCDDCGGAFAHSSQLVIHRRVHTGEKPFGCPECSAKFSAKSSLTVHRRSHTAERPYRCLECPAKFTSNSHLTVHKRIHSGERPYACDVCEKTFAENSSLSKHRRIHTGEKPYSCLECPAKFTDSSSLTRHKRIHSGERPHTCNECAKTFIEKRQLTLHKQTHNGVKRYSCLKCSARFAQSGRLTLHKRIHDEEGPQSRTECRAQFATGSTLTRHKDICSRGNRERVTDADKISSTTASLRHVSAFAGVRNLTPAISTESYVPGNFGSTGLDDRAAKERAAGLKRYEQYNILMIPFMCGESGIVCLLHSRGNPTMR